MSACPHDVFQVLVKAGDKVAVGDPLVVMIAMKMEVRHCRCPTHTFFFPSSFCLTHALASDCEKMDGGSEI